MFKEREIEQRAHMLFKEKIFPLIKKSARQIQRYMHGVCLQKFSKRNKNSYSQKTKSLYMSDNR